MSPDRPSAPEQPPRAVDDLVRDCLEHRPGAWEEFLARYSNLVYATVLKIGLDRPDQEEAFQSSILAIYRQLPALRDPERLVAWIVGISHRQAVNRVRARRREASLEDLSEIERTRAESLLVVESDAPIELQLSLERAQQAQETLAALPQRCRRLLFLLFHSDPPLDYAEIATREKIPIGSIGPTRARCLEKARRIFESNGWE